MKWMEDKADGFQETRTAGPCVSDSPEPRSTVSPSNSNVLLCDYSMEHYSCLSPLEKHPTRALQPKIFCFSPSPFWLAVSQPGPLLPALGVAGLLCVCGAHSSCPLTSEGTWMLAELPRASVLSEEGTEVQYVGAWLG